MTFPLDTSEKDFAQPAQDKAEKVSSTGTATGTYALSGTATWTSIVATFK